MGFIIEWRFEFPEVLDSEGNFLGFDIVIGNPPYGVKLNSELRRILVNFDELVPDFEVYLYFISKGITLVKPKGQLTYIQPNTFLAILYGKNYRSKILNEFNVLEIVDLSNQNTFEDASVRGCILQIQNIASDDSSKVTFLKVNDNKDFYPYKIFSKDELTANIDNWLSFFNQSSQTTQIAQKIRSNSYKVNDFCDVIRGYIAYRRSDLIRLYGESKGNDIIDKRLWHSDTKISEDYKEEILGKDLAKYSYKERNLFVKYGKHLASYVDVKFYKNPHIVIREIAEKTLVCAYLELEIYSSSSTHLVIQKDKNTSLKFIIALLNSKLIGWYHHNTSPKAKKGLFPKVLVNDINNFPIKQISEKDQQPFVALVDRILKLKKEGKDTLDMENDIDSMVYRLYDLTDEEIAIVEGKGNKNSLTILDMNQQDAQKIAREIAQKIELQLTEFFEKNAIEKFESIGEKFKTIDNPFDKLISEMIQEWKEFDVTPDSPFNFTYIDNALIDDLRYINKKYYQNFLFFGVLSSFFGRSSSPLFIQYRDELLKKHKLTPNKLKKALLDVFGYLLNNGKRGGSKGIWSKKKKLELLALYNRFLIVIKNARRDKRILKKKTNSELKIKKELIAKYEVPENLMPSLFSDDTPKDVALDWAIREMKLDKSNRDYLDKIILRNARKLWKNKGILIDVSIELGEHRFYGIRSEDKAIIKSQKDGLRYTRVCKNPKIGSIESEKDLKDFLKSENYLINFGFTRE